MGSKSVDLFFRILWKPVCFFFWFSEKCGNL